MSRRKAWEYPDCPECKTPIFVHGIGVEGAFVCEICDITFYPDGEPD